MSNALRLLLGLAALVGGGAPSSQAQRVPGNADSNVVLQHHGRITFTIGNSTERTWLLESGTYLQDDKKHPISDQAVYRPHDPAGANDALSLNISWDWDAGRFEVEGLEIASRFGDSGLYKPKDSVYPARCSLQITEYSGGAVRGSGACSPGDPDGWPVRFTFSAMP